MLGALRNGSLDCIIQVQMLGEGFDHPKLSVAAIFRPFRSLAPYIQFVGRIMRVIVQNDPTHPDNIGRRLTSWWHACLQGYGLWLRSRAACHASTGNGGVLLVSPHAAPIR